MVLNLFQLNQNFKKLKGLIIDDDNLINEDLWRLFGNVTRMIMYTTKHNGKTEEKFNVLQFLQRITRDIYGLTVIVKATRYRWRQMEDSWLLKEYKNLDQFEFKKFDFNNIKMSQTLDDQQLIEDCLVIHC